MANTAHTLDSAMMREASRATSGHKATDFEAWSKSLSEDQLRVCIRVLSAELVTRTHPPLPPK